MQDKEVIELEKTLEQIWEIALRFGLDPFPTKFEIVPATVMYEVGSYALPGRYSHWSFGKAYHRMKTMYDFGLSKIYEVVINTNPSYAFLLETNSLLQNKLVIAHVLGHTDFFKNNTWFSKTNRRMIDTASNHTARMNEYEFKYGHKAVETFLDSVLAIEEHIDPNFFIKRNEAKNKREALQAKEGVYDDIFALDKSEPDEPEDELKLILDMFDDPKVGNLDEKDIVYFIMNNSPVLKDWQRDVMAMIHEEMEYFVPQMQTKTINEGWASFFHSRIMRELNLSDSDHLEFADLHSSVVCPHKGSLNPYYIGYSILEDIEKRFGYQKLFEVRELENDVSLLRNYLTEELVEKLDLYVFELVEEEEWTITEKRWERVRDQLVANMTNFGFPYIVVADGNYNDNRELYLKHNYEGTELDEKYARKTLEHIYNLWGRKVHLETTVDDDKKVFRFDGEDHDED
ncbi:MAG: SpoVR family protein [Pyrinomonadaceae bacterium]|nr:SpoVR family protein [Pyrinomonadaceae bacterium]